MATAVRPPPPTDPHAIAPFFLARLPASIWQAPLVPVALAMTAGILLDRQLDIPLPFSLLAVAAGLVSWAAARNLSPAGLPLLYLWASVAAAAAAYHHWRRDVAAADDIGLKASAEPTTVVVRGHLETQPARLRGSGGDPLRSFPRPEASRFVLRVTQVSQGGTWQSASGLLQVTALTAAPGVDVGDEVELIGQLVQPRRPANPGEPDRAALLRDQGISAVLTVKDVPGTVTRMGNAPAWSLARALAEIRGWGQRVLEEWLPPPESGLAVALLLGETSALSPDEWEKYQRTGIVHVLAISGQHLVVLAGALWFVLRLAGVSRRRGAWFVALFLLGYALLTGGRPPVIRAVAMVGAVCGGIVLRLPVHPANTFALAWIVVALCSPSDLFTPGCQLSFLAVAVLCWGGALWQRPPSDALEKLAQESLPTWRRLLGRGLACVGVSFVVTLAVWLALAPLVAAHYHVVSPAAVLIGPAAVLLTSVALVAGFLLLGAAALGLPAWPLAWLTRLALGGCDALVDAADAWPGSYWYVTDLPAWWTWTFYLGLLAWLTLHPLRLRWRWAALAGLAWLCVGLSGSLLRAPRGEFRCTFLAVGHGGCAVLQTPDGRTFLYDAGSMGGPEVARRQIAPYLWHRGIRRIDEVFLSHADLDHYNGLLPLLDRFAVGQVSCTPSFGDRQSAASVLTLTALERRGVPVRVLCAGDRLEAGGVTFEVLHPPARGPEGNENARSLVLLVRHAGHSLLLTGDLEGEGLTCLLARQPIRVDVLMAPHHGGKSANTSALAKWAGPRVVVSSQAKPRGSWRADPVYEAAGGRFLSTWNDGAVAIRSGAEGLIVETYQSGQSWTVLPARAAH